MAGFGDKFNVNTKCLVIAGGLAGAYWIAPKKNWWVVGGILFFGYIGIAWYDELYDCKQKLKYRGGLIGDIEKPLKPPINPETQEYTSKL